MEFKISQKLKKPVCLNGYKYNVRAIQHDILSPYIWGYVSTHNVGNLSLSKVENVFHFFIAPK